MKEILFFLVDDDEDDRELFQLTIEEMGPGYKSQAVGSAAEALKILKKATVHPSYIFIDLNMPLMNGRECLIELKRDNILKNIPAVIYSTSADPRDIAETQALGAVGFITKPSRMSELAELIKNIIHQTSK